MATPFDLIHNALGEQHPTPVEKTNAIINALISGGYRFNNEVQPAQRHTPHVGYVTASWPVKVTGGHNGMHVIATRDGCLSGRGLRLDVLLIEDSALPLSAEQWSSLAPCLLPNGRAYVVREPNHADVQEN